MESLPDIIDEANAIILVYKKPFIEPIESIRKQIRTNTSMKWKILVIAGIKINRDFVSSEERKRT